MSNLSEGKRRKKQRINYSIANQCIRIRYQNAIQHQCSNKARKTIGLSEIYASISIKVGFYEY